MWVGHTVLCLLAGVGAWATSEVVFEREREVFDNGKKSSTKRGGQCSDIISKSRYIHWISNNLMIA